MTLSLSKNSVNFKSSMERIKKATAVHIPRRFINITHNQNASKGGGEPRSKEVSLHATPTVTKRLFEERVSTKPSTALPGMTRVKPLSKLEGSSAASRLTNLRKRASQQVIRREICNTADGNKRRNSYMKVDLEGPFKVEPNHMGMFALTHTEMVKEDYSQRFVSTQNANSKVISKPRSPLNEQTDEVVTASPIAIEKAEKLNLRRMTPVPGFHPFKTSGKLLNRHVRK